MGSSGVEQLRAIGALLKAKGARDLRLEMRAGLRAATKPLIEEIRQSAQDTLPVKGGANTWVAGASFTTSTLLTGRNVGIRIRGVKTGHNLLRVEDGTLRHPVFGHRDRWATTPVTAGFMSRSLEVSAPAVEAALLAVLDRTEAQIKSL